MWVLDILFAVLFVQRLWMAAASKGALLNIQYYYCCEKSKEAQNGHLSGYQRAFNQPSSQNFWLGSTTREYQIWSWSIFAFASVCTPWQVMLWDPPVPSDRTKQDHFRASPDQHFFTLRVDFYIQHCLLIVWSLIIFCLYSQYSWYGPVLSTLPQQL